MPKPRCLSLAANSLKFRIAGRQVPEPRCLSYYIIIIIIIIIILLLLIMIMHIIIIPQTKTAWSR